MAKAKQQYDAKGEAQLMTELWAPALKDDPLAFVMFVFPWGEPNTPLAEYKGPRKWQIAALNRIKQHLAEQDNRHRADELYSMLREATASGRGIGKSALVAWLVLWMLSTRIGSTVVVTANTEAQLTSRTWAELGKWHTLALNSHWFDRSAMSLRPAEWFDKQLKNQLKVDTGYYYAQAQLWSEEKPDAFAGVHNPAGIMVIMDEASGIPQPIWTVSEGFFTEPVRDRYWFAFSNPRNNTGAFFECFHAHRRFWNTTQIDSRTVEGTDPAVYQQYLEKYGEDSDEARVEVYGQFPNQGDRQFIAMDAIMGARERELVPDQGAPLVLGVDVARYGDDSSVIAFRRGRDARSLPWQRYNGLDTMTFADRVAEAIEKYSPEAVFVDENGVGGAVVDRLRQLGFKVTGVNSQGAPRTPNRYLNKRAEMWDLMREWLVGYGCIALDKELADDLKGPKFGFENRAGTLQLESKEKVKDRGLASPDKADALALTFSHPVARIDVRHSRTRRRHAVAAGVDYDILRAR